MLDTCQLLHTHEDALRLLRAQGANGWLVRHHELVLEAARELLAGLKKLPGRGDVRAREVLLGAALHDVGKVEHPEEMSGPGSHHEPAGEALLLRAGVPASLARICRTDSRSASGPRPRRIL